MMRKSENLPPWPTHPFVLLRSSQWPNPIPLPTSSLTPLITPFLSLIAVYTVAQIDVTAAVMDKKNLEIAHAQLAEEKVG